MQGDELRALGESFVGRHVVPRYRGYMQSQAMRLLGTARRRARRRGGGRRDELIAEHGYDTKYAMHCARLGFQCIELLRHVNSICRFKVNPPTGCERFDAAMSASTSGGRASQNSTVHLEKLAVDEALPPAADRRRIERWSVEAHLTAWQTR